MSIGRMAEIVKVFAEEGLGSLTARKGELKLAAGAESSTMTPEALSDRETAIRLRRVFERLGPTFVKFGQILATRIDLFSDDFIAELGQLHSKVPPFDHSTATQIIEEELGRPLSDVFESFPDQPIAAASVAQVYKAKLKTGENVAVKVQRPNLEESLVRDIQLIVQISGWLDNLLPSYRKSMMHSAAEEYARSARSEINFRAEAIAIERFGDILKNDPYFVVPRVFQEFCSEKLVLMDWLDGKKLDQFKNSAELKAAGGNPKDLSQNLFRLQICMSYEYGQIHGDTHPGNLILLHGGNRIGLIDFGLNAVVSKFVQNKMLEAIMYQSSGQSERLVDVMVELTPPANASQTDAYKNDLRKIVSGWFDQSASLAHNKISEQTIKGIRVGAKYRNRARPELLVVMRNLSIVEGIILRFDPDFLPLPAAKKILNDIMKRKLSPTAIKDQVTPMLAELGLAISRKPELAQRLMHLERSFIDSPSIGDFLRKEKIIEQAKNPNSRRLKDFVLFAVGIALGACLIYFSKV